MIFSAPASLAPSNPFKPTPPNPTHATVSPARMRAVFSTAPTPVITAQPNIAASAKGRSLSTLTAVPRSTTAYSAKQETPD